jgi:geranylgeranyl diphosphate synthase, type II
VTLSLASLIRPYQEQIEQALSCQTSVWGTSKELKEACLYSLSCGGKRFRPILVLMMAKALSGVYNVEKAALAVEYFHTASLIADDLPCMDDDRERRGKPSTHVVFGEAAALLASYALIAAGYRLIADNGKEMGHKNGAEICILAILNAAENTGVLGATGGQCLDLFPPDFELSTYMETVLKKTVSLFEISFVLGWLFGGGDPGLLPLVKKAAYHFGMAFQIADDIDDYEEDAVGKRAMNAVSLLGKGEAEKMFHEEIGSYLQGLVELNIDDSELKVLAEYLNQNLKKAVL